METPRSYAAHLATYIASPLKIEKLVALEFDNVPPLREIAELRYRVEREKKAFRSQGWIKDNPDHDGEDYAVRSFLRKPEPRTYTNSRTVYVPAHVEVSPGFDRDLTVRSHRDLITVAAAAFGLSYEDAISANRHAPHICARAVAARLLRERGNTYSQIGHYLGGRDHSTAINLCRKFNERARRHPQMQVVYERLLQAVAA